MYDLHVHSNFSDGKLGPKELVDYAKSVGLDGISITDHDTVDAVDASISYGKERDIEIIPGIEFSCDYHNEEVHILGYFIDYKNPELLDITNKLKESRKIRLKKIIETLNSININIDFNDIKSLTRGNNLGRYHIAQALENKNYVESTEEAFNLYLNKGKIAYIDRFKLSIEETIKLIHKVGGLAIIAHPGLLNTFDPLYYSISKGINGIEVLHSKHSLSQVYRFIEIAHKHKLLFTAGSDCHGKIINNQMLMGKYGIEIENINLWKGGKIDLFQR